MQFTEGRRDGRARLFVTALAVDPIAVRVIGRREPTAIADHKTFGVEHHHRHLKDYFVEDPRGITNPDRNTGATGRPEWPPFNPPEQQWLWRDDLVGGWGQTRLQIEPAGARQADRFLTVLVPADEGASAPTVLPARTAVGQAAGAVVRQGARNDVVVFSSDPGGADLARGAVDVNLEGRAGDLTIVNLTPGTHYSVRIGGGGRVQRIAISTAAAGGVTADAAGMVRIRLDAVPRVGGATIASGSGGSVSAAHAGAPGSATDPGSGAGSAPAVDAGGDGLRSPHASLVAVNAESGAALAEWDARVTQMLRAGELRLREIATDALVKGRTYQRLTQLYEGVPVFGGDLTRSMQGSKTVAVNGALYRDIDVDPEPGLTDADAADIFRRMSAGARTPPVPELTVLPTDDDGYVLTYRARVPVSNDVQMAFIDANTGETVLAFSELRRRHR